MNVSAILKDKRFQVAAISLVALGGGVGVAYIWKKRKAKSGTLISIKELSFYDRNPELLEEMLADPDGDVISEAKTAAVVTEIPDEESDIDPEEEDEVNDLANALPPERVNVFDRPNQIPRDVWDYEVERNTRTADDPYVIHSEEYIQDEMGFRQITTTYYEGDDVMTDQNDVPIYNWHGQMGELKFGHGSGDPNAVYIRNERLRQEWEVIYNPGRFEYIVQGKSYEEADEAELRHSGHKVQKFRKE